MADATALVVEGARPATDLAALFFNSPIIDNRFQSVDYMPVQPISDYTSQDTIEFEIPKFSNNHCLLMHAAMIEVNLRLLDTQGNIPEEGKVVSFSNNIVNSLFQDCEITVNGARNIMHSCNYNYKSLIKTMRSTEGAFIQHYVLHVARLMICQFYRRQAEDRPFGSWILR